MTFPVLLLAAIILLAARSGSRRIAETMERPRPPMPRLRVIEGGKNNLR